MRRGIPGQLNCEVRVFLAHALEQIGQPRMNDRFHCPEPQQPGNLRPVADAVEHGLVQLEYLLGKWKCFRAHLCQRDLA